MGGKGNKMGAISGKGRKSYGSKENVEGIQGETAENR